MSGSVIKFNEEDEDDDEEGDIAGLLARHRDQEDFDDEDHNEETTGRSGRSRRNKFGRKKGGKTSSLKKTPFAVVRSSSLAQLLLHTFALCCVFFAIGLTKSLVDIPSTSEGIIEPSQKEISAAVGYVLGFLLGGILLSRLSQSFLVLLTMCVLSSVLFLVPWTTAQWAYVTVYGVIGGTVAILMIEGNVLCFDFWGKKSGPYIQALHFCLSLGLLTGPLLVEPISQARVPDIVQKALPHSQVKVSAPPTPATVYSVPHFIVKRDIAEDLSSGPTLDPLLAELFATQQPPQKQNQTQPPPPTQFVSTESPSSPTPIKTPKPKPIFTDARKLDNSRDWENVKIAKPPQEELVALTTTTVSTSTTNEQDPVLLLLSANEDMTNDNKTGSTPISSEPTRESKNLAVEVDPILQLLESDGETTTLQATTTISTTSTTTTSTTAATTSTKTRESDPVLVLLEDSHNPQSFIHETTTAAEKILESTTNTTTGNQVAYEIHQEVVGLEKDIKNNDKLLEWISAPEESQPAPIRSKRDTQTQLNIAEKIPKHIVTHSHHYAIHSPLLSEPRTHDEKFLKLHPRPEGPVHLNPKTGDPEIPVHMGARHHRRVRDVAAHPRIGFSGDEPPLYNRQRFSRPHSRLQPPPAPMWPVPRTAGSINDFQPSPYLDYSDPMQGNAGGDYMNFEPKGETLPPPPEKVEEAFQTIKEYLKNPDSIEDVMQTDNSTPRPRTTTKTTTTTATTTSTSTSTTTTTATTTVKGSTTTTLAFGPQQMVTISEKKKSSHRKKPLSSFDNDTETDLTLQTVFNNYGVSQENIGFILDASYCLMVTGLLLLCSCYRPREPRTRMAMAEMHSGSGDRIFKATLIVLLFFFNLLHWGMFIGCRRLLPKFVVLSSSTANVERMFVGVFTASRFIAIFTAGIFSPASLLFASLFLVLIGSLLLVFMQQIATGAVWAGVVLQAVGLSTLLPTSLQWGESYILMYPHVVAGVCWGLSLGELMIPHLLNFFSSEAMTWIGFSMLGATFLCLGLFLCVFLMARKHESRCGRPQASGYELASQNDLNEDLLEDDDDFEVTEATLQFNNEAALLSSREANA